MHLTLYYKHVSITDGQQHPSKSAMATYRESEGELDWTRSEHHGGTAVHWPFSAVGGLRICTVSDVETPPLVHIATAYAALSSAWPGAVGVVAQPPLPKRPKAPVELPGEDWGGDPSPPLLGMRERE